MIHQQHDAAEKPRLHAVGSFSTAEVLATFNDSHGATVPTTDHVWTEKLAGILGAPQRPHGCDTDEG